LPRSDIHKSGAAAKSFFGCYAVSVGEQMEKIGGGLHFQRAAIHEE